jgi:hypothetical protein
VQENATEVLKELVLTEHPASPKIIKYHLFHSNHPQAQQAN